jgi:hypothetical protein
LYIHTIRLAILIAAVQYLRVATLRNRRLETLLGSTIDQDLTYEQVNGLIPAVAEGVDLDFKGEIYKAAIAIGRNSP